MLEEAFEIRVGKVPILDDGVHLNMGCEGRQHRQRGSTAGLHAREWESRGGAVEWGEGAHLDRGDLRGGPVVGHYIMVFRDKSLAPATTVRGQKLCPGLLAIWQAPREHTGGASLTQRGPG